MENGSTQYAPLDQQSYTSAAMQAMAATGSGFQSGGGSSGNISNTIGGYYCYPQHLYCSGLGCSLGCSCHHWHSSPDKTAKAIEIMKKLEPHLESVKTIPDFLAVVDEIVKIL